MKTQLTIDQSSRLIELGVDKEKASEYSSYMKTSASCRGIIQVPTYNPIFTLADILSLLPKEITHNGVTENLTIIVAPDKATVSYPFYDSNDATFTAPELIDALYELLIWTVENGYLKP